MAFVNALNLILLWILLIIMNAVNFSTVILTSIMFYSTFSFNVAKECFDYSIIFDKMNWVDAAAKCEEFGGQIASSRDKYHLNLIKTMSKNFPSEYIFVSFESTFLIYLNYYRIANTIKVGGRTEYTLGNWSWISGGYIRSDDNTL
jgi:hypothetical protein